MQIVLRLWEMSFLETKPKNLQMYVFGPLVSPTPALGHALSTLPPAAGRHPRVPPRGSQDAQERPTALHTP
eukprot:8126816-Pyramimonas_sp.AAC.1